MGIKTTYTANLYEQGIVKGSIIKKVWFWANPVSVHKQMAVDVREAGYEYGIADFRKV